MKTSAYNTADSAQDEEAGKKAAEAAKRILGARVKDVRISKRLAEEPLLRCHGQG